ncbi:MAG: hypothetical protein FRX48_00853 [Lasallia pustulata]|uniref:Uncharacterized protein n=1 Tax=Lasallia pustulata TaxID=136370 RepID=A0A5M8Q1R2_9LECA|nr:MAG: hypothetical protein FRX48_00853 [Lasallia pustulata]
MSFQFSPLYLHRSSPLNSSLRSFTPATCPQHPIHNAEFEDEIPTLTPAPLFAGQGRPLRRFLPTTTLETLLATFDLRDELDACLDQWLQDGTASRMREAEIAEAEASSQEPILPSRKSSSLSTDMWAQAGTYQKPMLPSRKSSSLSTDMWAQAGTYQKPMLPSRKSSSLHTDMWVQAGTYRASQAESAESDNSDSSESSESDLSSFARPSIFEYIDIHNQLTSFQIKVSRSPRKMSEPISPKTVERHF